MRIILSPQEYEWLKNRQAQDTPLSLRGPGATVSGSEVIVKWDYVETDLTAIQTLYYKTRSQKYTLTLTDEEFAQLEAELNAPAKVNLKLEALLNEPTTWDKEN